MKMHWILPLTVVSLLAILAGIKLSQREDRIREDTWARHYAPPESVETCRAIREAEAVLEEVLRRERR